MKRWYLFYYEQVIKGHQASDQIDVTEKSHQVGGLLEMPDFHIDALSHPPKAPFFDSSL